jgi:outer membrane protein assembly complex protein YaeT
MSSRKLREALYSLRSDSYFSEQGLQRGVQELTRALGLEGYFQPKIRTEVKRSPGSPQVEVTFDIFAGARYIISDIRFAGAGPISEKELRQKMKTRSGTPYSVNRLEQDLPRLRAMYTRLSYPRAEVEQAPENFFLEEGTVSLLIKIDPQERIEVSIEGAKISSRLVLPIWEERVFEDWGLSEGEARILADLRGKGYIFASVRSVIEKIDGGIRVVHRVKPGRKYRIKELRFQGNHYLTADQINAQLMTSESIGIFGGIDGRRAYELPDEIEVLYQTQGFPDVQVSLSFLERGEEAIAVYVIEEGKQRRIRGIEFIGASLLSPEKLRGLLAIRVDGPYFAPAIQREIQKLETFYLDQGIRGTTIEAKSDPLGDDSFQVTFEIGEGKKTLIQSLFISGNLVTRQRTITRELKIREGEEARLERLTASRANLEKLGVFSEVKIEEIPLTPGTENLAIRLREGERNYVGLGVGLETRDELSTSSLLQANLRPRATAEFMRSNILGTAAHLSLVTQFSLAEKRLVVSWEQPYFLFSLPIETYLSGWLEDEDRISFGYKRQGISLSGIKPIFWDLTLLAAVRYARTTLTFLDIAPSEIDREFYPYSATSFESSFIRERRDDPFNPERGYFSSLSLQWAFPLFQTESDFLKAAFKYQRYFTLVPRVVLGSTFRLGLGMGRMPVHERFFGGGSNSFRGQKFDALGPKDPESGKPVGGKALFLLNFELAFPVVSTLPSLSGVVFYDAGNVFASRNDFSLLHLEHAVGLGVRYRTPLGPVRLELGWNLTDPARKKKPVLFITIGNIF